MTSPVIIRPIQASDEGNWRSLWTAYLEFYETALAEDIYSVTFERLLSDDPSMPSGFIAEIDGRAIGLVHYLYHAHCWRHERVCYLQDLFVNPSVRGGGTGRALIEAVYEQADAEGAPAVYWLTQENNRDARMLYDKIATVVPFVKYQR